MGNVHKLTTAGLGVAAVLGAALVAGCSPVDNIELLSWSVPGGSSPGAALEGQLTLVDDCLRALAEDGTSWALVFEAGLDAKANRDSLTVNGAEFRIDGQQTVVLGGGQLTDGQLASASGPVASECNGSPAWLVTSLQTQ